MQIVMNFYNATRKKIHKLPCNTTVHPFLSSRLSHREHRQHVLRELRFSCHFKHKLISAIKTRIRYISKMCLKFPLQCVGYTSS
jgi:hypothetical protein